MLKRFIKIGDALSQLANTLLLAGDPNESISDWLFLPFQANHCLKAYTNDVERARRLLDEHEARRSF